LSLEKFESYLGAGWQQHAIDPGRVVASLPSGLSLLDGDAACEVKLPDFARLVEHSFLGHLGSLGDAEPWLQRLRERRHALPPSRIALARMAFAIDVSHGRRPALPSIPDDQQLSGCANGLVAHCVSGPADAAFAWLGQFARELPSAPRARAKALAGAMNSLSFHLMLFPLGTHTARIVVESAALSREATLQSGTWAEVSRAEGFLSTAHVAAGNGAEAVECARRCGAILGENGAPASDRLSAAASLARAAVAAADPHLAASALHAMERGLDDIHDVAARRTCELELRDVRTLVESHVASPAHGLARELAAVPASD
jgi:hypothetical protein